MYRGIAAPILILLIGFLAVTFVGTQFLNKEEVKGVSDTNLIAQNGFSVTVSSTGTWDLFQYLCEDVSCLDELIAGVRYSTVSGGATEAHEVVVSPGLDWDKYEYVKVYVKPGWGVSDTTYIVKGVSEYVREVSDGMDMVLLIPMELVQSAFVEGVALFSDF